MYKITFGRHALHLYATTNSNRERLKNSLTIRGYEVESVMEGATSNPWVDYGSMGKMWFLYDAENLPVAIAPFEETVRAAMESLGVVHPNASFTFGEVSRPDESDSQDGEW